MTSRSRFVVAISVGALVVALAAAQPASAATSGSATAEAAYGAAAAIAPAAPVGSGILGSTLSDLIAPIVNTLTQQINSLVSTSVVALLNSGGNVADTTTGPSSYPTGPLASVSVPGVLGLTLNGPSGSISATPSAYSAMSEFSSPSLSVLGLSVASLGVASASVNCPTSGTGNPTAAVTLSGVSLFGGAVNAKLANGTNLLQVQLNGGAWQSVTGLGSTLTPVAGTAVLVKADGDLLQVTASISLSTLLGGIGLGGLLSTLNGAISTTGTALNLSLTIGPGSATPGNGSATAWGLEVGVDLSGTISVSELSVLGDIGGTSVITIPTGIESNVLRQRSRPETRLRDLYQRDGRIYGKSVDPARPDLSTT